MLPRNTGTKGDIIGTGVNDLALLRDPTKASTTAAVGQDTAGTGADFLPWSLHHFLVLPIHSMLYGLVKH